MGKNYNRNNQLHISTPHKIKKIKKKSDDTICTEIEGNKYDVQWQKKKKKLEIKVKILLMHDIIEAQISERLKPKSYTFEAHEQQGDRPHNKN